MRPSYFLLIALVIVGCEKKPNLHLADLPPAKSPGSEITYYPEPITYRSSEPTHNLVPPHGPHLEKKGHHIPFEEKTCATAGETQFCYTVDQIQSRVQLSASQGEKTAKSLPLGGGLSNILPRFLGAPPAKAYRIIQFDNHTAAIVVTGAVEVFHKGNFCKPFSTNPNGRLHIGTDPAGTPLFLTSGPYRENLADRRAEGWREYSLTQLCSQ